MTLTSTGWGPVILDEVGVVTDRLCKLGDPIVLGTLDLCWTVNTTWEEAVNNLKINTN